MRKVVMNKHNNLLQLEEHFYQLVDVDEPNTFRNLFRYKKRLIMTISGILGCTALLVVGMAIKNSVTDLMPKQYNHIYRYDMMAVVMAEDYDNFTKQIDTDSNISDYLGLQMDTVQAKMKARQWKKQFRSM